MNIISVGAIFSALGVIFGAFGTHGLRGKIEPELLQIFETGTHYLMLHAFAILFYGFLKSKVRWPAWCFIIGIFIFTGSLYAITFTEIKKFGMITPIGGVLFIAGWIGFAIQARKQTSS